jgi:hypothetical protein
VVGVSLTTAGRFDKGAYHSVGVGPGPACGRPHRPLFEPGL